MNSVSSELLSDQTLNLTVSFLTLNIYFNSEAQSSTFNARNILTHSDEVLSSSSKTVGVRVRPGSWLVPGKVSSPPKVWHVGTLCGQLTRDC